MSTDTPAETAAPAPATPAVVEETTVPYSRFAEVNQAAKDREKQLQEMASRLEELENRDKSELERERAKRETFEKQAADMAARLERVERSNWIRSAAAAAGFEDPDDAVAFISTDSVESDTDAEKAVAKLAKRKPRLLREQTPAANIGQVVQNGQPIGQQQATQPEDPAALALLEQVKAAQSSGWTSTTIDE
jgi:hypothetical protein